MRFHWALWMVWAASSVACSSDSASDADEICECWNGIRSDLPKKKQALARKRCTKIQDEAMKKTEGDAAAATALAAAILDCSNEAAP